jgi:methyl-accepting chemotaxis protein
MPSFKISHKLVLVVALSLSALASLAVYDLTLKWSTRAEMAELGRLAQGVAGVSQLIHELQRERGASVFFVSSQGAQFRAELAAQRKLTDDARRLAGQFIAGLRSAASNDFRQKIDSAESQMQALDDRRAAIDALAISGMQAVSYFSDTIARLFAATSEIAKVSNRGEVTTAIAAYINLMQGKERAGQERATGAGGIAAGKLDLTGYMRLLGLIAAQESYFVNFESAATPAQRDFFRQAVSGEAQQTVARLRDILAKGGLSGDMQGLDGKAWFDATTARIDILKKVEDRLGSDLVALTAAIQATATQSFLGLGAIVLMAFLCCLTIAFVLARGITRPLSRLTAAMGRLAGGDFSFEVPGCDRRDEIGEISRAVERFKIRAVEKAQQEADQKQAQAQAAAAARRDEMQKLADAFETAVGVIVDRVSGSAGELERAANRLSTTANTTQRLATVVAGASEECSANVSSVASATNEMTSSVSEIARQVQESSKIAGEAVQQAEKTDARIAELSQAASRIGEVVKLITSVAEQTNLLALNATIEAARAGEAGKGFAVVAQEVKALAGQTAKATDEIGTQIAGMQTATADSVSAIKEIGGTIGRISQIASAIAAAVEEQGAATQEIARNVQQAAQGTAQVASNIVEVNTGASETGSASSQVLSSAQALSSEGNKLKLEVVKFLATVRAA